MLLKMAAIGLLGLLIIGHPAVAARVEMSAVPAEVEISAVPKGCTYNGRVYKIGAKIADVCTDMTCVAGKWSTTGMYDGNCGFCSLRDDPHIKTFDQVNYDYHGLCNYSVSQKGFGFNEAFGIYSQFKPCGSAACMDLTTFTDNPNTVISISHPTLTTVNVNGVPVTLTNSIQGLGGSSQPVLAWMSNGCNMFLGSQGFLLRACSNQLFVWAVPTLLKSLYGLCGFFTLNPTDDFTERAGVVQPLSPYPITFPESWQTAEQSKMECREGDACKGGDDSREKKYEICKTLLSKVLWQNKAPSGTTLNQAILDCTTDLCVLDEKKAKATEIEAWKKTMQTMLQNDIMIEAKTTVDCTTDLCVLDEKRAKSAEIEAWKKTMQTMLQTDIMIAA